MTKPRTGIPVNDGKSPFSSAFTGDTSSKYSKPHSGGLRSVANEEAWGEAKATQRYGGGTRTFGPPKDVQAPQDPVDKHSPNYDNDTSGQIRAEGENAEHGPAAYVPGYRAPRGEPGTRGGPPLRMTPTPPHYSNNPTRSAYGPTRRGMGRPSDD